MRVQIGKVSLTDLFSSLNESVFSLFKTFNGFKLFPAIVAITIVALSSDFGDDLVFFCFTVLLRIKFRLEFKLLVIGRTAFITDFFLPT